MCRYFRGIIGELGAILIFINRINIHSCGVIKTGGGAIVPQLLLLLCIYHCLVLSNSNLYLIAWGHIIFKESFK